MNARDEMQSLLPYMSTDDSRYSITEEVEAAVTLLLSLNNKEAEIEEVIKISYPFMAFETDEGKIYFDLLMLSELEKPQIVSFEINDAINRLVESKDNERESIIASCKSMLSNPCLETILIKGLVEDDRINQYLQKREMIESKNPVLFNPQLTQKRFKTIKDKLRINEKERETFFAEIMQTKKNAKKIYEKLEKENTGKLESYAKESDKNLDKLEKKNTKAIKKAEKEQEKQIKEINKKYDARVKELIDEKESISKNQEELQGGNWETRKHRLENEIKLRQLSRQMENMEKEKSKELVQLQNANAKTQENLRQELIEAEEHEKQLILELEDKNKKNLEEIIELIALIEHLETRVEKEKEYLARISKLKYKDGQKILVPFYIYKTDGVYGFHSPMKIGQMGGVKKTLKSILADNLRDKTLQYIEPETGAFDELMDNLLIELSSETKLRKEYDKKFGEENLLNSRYMLDKIEVGLYKLFEWEWINEKDYMIAQRSLVEKIDILNGGSLFQNDSEPIPETVPTEEIPV